MRDGNITAVRANIVLDGVRRPASELLFQAVCQLSGAYNVPNVYVDGTVAYTNKVPMGAFRGFGKPQATFAVSFRWMKQRRRFRWTHFESGKGTFFELDQERDKQSYLQAV